LKKRSWPGWQNLSVKYDDLQFAFSIELVNLIKPLKRGEGINLLAVRARYDNNYTLLAPR